MTMDSKTVERFWSKVKLGEGNECWPWLGGKNGLAKYSPGRYGAFYIDGKQIAAHRFSFFLANHRWPNVTRHKCDNTLCVNPAHLEDGTHQDNVQDALSRGRFSPATKTKCKYGHDISREAGRIYFGAKGERTCAICADANHKAQRERAKLADPEAYRAKRKEYKMRARAKALAGG